MFPPTCAIAGGVQVRGAPAIAIVAALALAVELVQASTAGKLPTSAAEVAALVRQRWSHLKTSRPTAVNLFDAADRLGALVDQAAAAAGAAGVDVVAAYVAAAERMLEDDVRDNRAIGHHGAARILSAAGDSPAEGAVVLTHCNTGSLATAGYGTALGIIRALHEQGRLVHVYCTETRPYNQVQCLNELLACGRQGLSLPLAGPLPRVGRTTGGAPDGVRASL